MNWEMSCHMTCDSYSTAHRALVFSEFILENSNRYCGRQKGRNSSLHTFFPFLSLLFANWGLWPFNTRLSSEERNQCSQRAFQPNSVQKTALRSCVLDAACSPGLTVCFCFSYFQLEFFTWEELKNIRSWKPLTLIPSRNKFLIYVVVCL